MAGMCYRVNSGEIETATPVEPSSESARRRRMEIHRFRFCASDVAVAPPSSENGRKRHKVEEKNGSASPSPATECENRNKRTKLNKIKLAVNKESFGLSENDSLSSKIEFRGVSDDVCPKFGVTSVCGRRRDMEDAVAIHPSLCRESDENSSDLHLFGVYDGHGCSHVAMKCKDRMHEIVKNEIESCEAETTWKEKMTRSFSRMDKEAIDRSSSTTEAGAPTSKCRCELQTPQCDAVGSTAVVALVTPEKIIVSNCGDSRAVLCRNGVAVPLSTDHKPDRPDELKRIEEAGGRVIYWDGARVLGVLAMSRAIGDNYLKPYVISEPEVTITERTEDDECLILASDGLWDVVSNETACGVARMCLRSARRKPSPPGSPRNGVMVADDRMSSDKACSDASILLTKLALARHSSDNVSVVVVDLRRDLLQN